ncbi:hypothetical protein GCM10025858_40390 [Alicyclobacillus sacchari]|nr:hypothetical protein GCM10025858_39480 [Alicyclobacillus sacchari]GMA59535.1 hypothetical protein GCM10025858_40390 [Alicyclobacillus sacchari]
MVPISRAATTDTSETLNINGQLFEIDRTTNGNETESVVTYGSEKVVAIYNSSTHQLLIQNPDGTTNYLNLDHNNYSPSKISPQLLQESVGDLWWGDYCSDNILSGSQYWYAQINGSTSWSGEETASNSSYLINFWNSVSSTRNAELAFEGAVTSGVVSAAISIITSETVLPAVIAGLSAIGLGFTAIYMAEQAWTDHRTDVIAFYQIPGA